MKKERMASFLSLFFLFVISICSFLGGCQDENPYITQTLLQDTTFVAQVDTVYICCCCEDDSTLDYLCQEFCDCEDCDD